MQRTGRKGHAMFRIVVQDSRRTPTSGRVVAYLGSYDPHQKIINLDKSKAKTYLDNGAQPSLRVMSLLKLEKVDLPKWVEAAQEKSKQTKNPDKRRSSAKQEAEPSVAAETVEAPTNNEAPGAIEAAPEGDKSEAK